MKKTYTLLLPLFLVLGTTQAFSQGLDPLLRSDTIAVAHLNLKNFDFDRFAECKIERIDSLFQKLDYDDDSREAISRETRTLVASKLNLIRPFYQMFVMATKLDDVYLVSYASGLETAPVIVATPLEGKSQNQIALLESLFADAPIKPFQLNGFLILAVPSVPYKGEEAAEWAEKHLEGEFFIPKSMLSAINEAFQNEDAIFRAVVIKPENIQELLNAADFSNVPPQIKIMLDMVLEKFQWVAFCVDPYAFSVCLTVQTSSETDAEELWELLKSTQDAGIEAMRIGLLAGIAQGAQENPALFLLTEYVPLFTEIARGAVRKTLPHIVGAKLIFLW